MAVSNEKRTLQTEPAALRTRLVQVVMVTAFCGVGLLVLLRASNRSGRVIAPTVVADSPGRNPTRDACERGEAGAIWCGEHCVSTATSAEHCGACGFQCAQGQNCAMGRCVLPDSVEGREVDQRARLLGYSGGTGSYGTWTSLGPRRGGRLDGIVANDSDQTDLFVAAPGGGVWRTQNNGSSWSLTGDYGLGDFSAWRLERDQISSSRLFLVTPMTVYATTDSGATWSNVGGYTMPTPLLSMHHSEFVSDPAPFAQMVFDSSTRFLLWGPSCSGLLYSTNGTSFTQLWPFANGSNEARNCINAIAVDPTTKRVFFSAMHRTSNKPSIYRSNCDWTSSGPCCTTPGSCWDLITSGLTDGTHTADIAYTGVSTWVATSTVVSGSSRLHNGSGSTTTWSATSSFPTMWSWDPRPLVYLGADHYVTGAAFPYSSHDIGSNWSQLSATDMHADVRGLYYSSALGRLWATTDGAHSDGSMGNIVRWNVSVGSTPTSPSTIPVTGDNGLPVWQAYFSAVVHRSSGGPRVMMGLQDNGGACSDDGGSSWNSGWGPNPDTYGFAQSPSDPDVGFAVGASGLVTRYANLSSASSCGALTTHSTSVIGTPPYWQRATLAVHPTNPDRLYAANGYRVTRATYSSGGLTAGPDHGAIINDGTADRYITTIAVDGSANLYVGTQDGGTFVSTDEGVSWSAWGPSWSPVPRAVLRIAFSSYGGGTSWIATTDGLYRKVGSGSWSVVTGGSGYTVNDVAVDPACPQRVYVALGFAARRAHHRGGIQITEDNGSSWASTTSGLALHQAPVADVEVQPNNSRYIYAAVYGQGLWRLDRGSTPSCP